MVVPPRYVCKEAILVLKVNSSDEPITMPLLLLHKKKKSKIIYLHDIKIRRGR
jgi:hypothetical protein